MSEITISNKFTAKYDLKGYAESNIDVTLTVGTYVDNQIRVDISTKGIFNSDKRVSIDVVFGSFSEIGVTISPSVFDSIPVEIEVNPHNRMSVYYELVKPPTVIYETFPVQDSFVIQRSPYSNINYGSNNSMIVGVDQKGENISFVKFDTSEVAHDIVMKQAKVRLYYNQLSTDGLSILRVNDKWQEYSITYNNMPKDLTSLDYNYTVNEEKRYIEFDVTPTVTDWIRGLDNYGLALKADSGVSIFGTREYPMAPALIIEYYSPLPFSNDISKKQIEITVARDSFSNAKVSLEVKSNFEFSYIPIEIFTKKKDEIFNVDIPIEIEISEHEDYSEVGIEIAVLLDDISEVPIEITVPVYEGISNIEVEIECKFAEIQHSDVKVEIECLNVGVQYSDIEVEVEVKSNEDINEIEVEIDVPISYYSIIEIEIECINNIVNYKDIAVELEIPNYHYSSISVELEVNQYEGSYNVEVEIDVPAREAHQDKKIEIGVWGHDISNAEVYIQTRVNFIDEIIVDIEVGKSNRFAYVFMF